MGKQWKVFLNEGPFSRKYLQERLHVLAVVEANIVGSDAVHCDGGCSALRGRFQCTAGKVALHCVLDRLINSKMHQSILGK